VQDFGPANDRLGSSARITAPQHWWPVLPKERTLRLRGEVPADFSEDLWETILAAAPFEPSCLLTPLIKREQGRPLMHKRYWLDYDPVAFVILVIGIGMIELLALSI
jgi:hypothetical protein